MEQPFIGRDLELHVLHAALADARAERPRLVLVDGPEGIGKTALIDRFLAESEDVHVLRASGDESETLVTYGVVDQLLRVGGAGGAAVMGAGERAVSPADHVAVGAQVLELVGSVEGDATVAVVVDDAQWADVPSLRALVFALRRLVADRVLVLVAIRPQDVLRLPEGLRRMAASEIGERVHLRALDTADLLALAERMGVEGFSARAAERLAAHTDGNPLYARALLEELPADVWRGLELELPAPHTFAAVVVRRARQCSPPARALVEAAAVLGMRCALEDAARLARAEAPLDALEEAVGAGLLRARESPGRRDVAFVHPLMQAAIYHHLGPARRVRLHLAAAAVATDDAAVLRHRVAAAPTSDPALAADLEQFAERQAARGSWAGAAAALVTASRLADGAECERRLLEAVDALLYAGDVAQAATLAEEVAAFARGPRRDCVLGFLAGLQSRPAEADRLLRSAWDLCSPDDDRALAATIARRTALHLLQRLCGEETVEWSRRALALSPPGDPAARSAELLPLGVGLGYAGRLAEGLETVEGALAGEPVLTVRRARGWLRLVADDVEGARRDLEEEAAAAMRLGSFGVAAYALGHLGRADHVAGAWDDAVVHAERGLAIAVEFEHPILRSLCGLAAVAVPAARGDWDVAERHVRATAARAGDYEHSLVAAGLAAAQLATARGDHEGVLAALGPLTGHVGCEGLDEPGFWPWQDLYGDALVAAGELDAAAAFLAPHEALAEARGRRSMIARLARVRGRLEGARGRAGAADAAFQAGLEALDGLALPVDRALLRLAAGQVLRRRGGRRAAAEHLSAAHACFAELGARPYRERCEAELVACGLAPAERGTPDRDRLTPQEHSVARLVASGLTNREVAAVLMLSARTVEYHLTRVYAKLGVASRTQLAARTRASEAEVPAAQPG